MRRTRTITAVDCDTDVRVTVAINSAGLTREESERQIDGLASAIMLAIPETRHFGAPLSKVKVKR